MSINFHELAQLSAAERRRLTTRTEADLSSFEEKVRPIIAAVKEEGDAAVARFARELDKAPVEAGKLAATSADFEVARQTSREAVAIRIAGKSRRMTVPFRG